MSELMIEVKEVSIRFKLDKEGVNSVKEYILFKMKKKVKYDELWALKNVSFQIKQGDSVGLLDLILI